MRVPFNDLKAEFKRVLLKYKFPEHKAEICSKIYAENSLDGVYSHGLNRFPSFIKYIKDGLINIDAEPEKITQAGVIEQWNGNKAPGMYVAAKAMERAIEIAKSTSAGIVAVKNTNHWMRGGTYGWQAANAGCIGLCSTNTIANMPPWGGAEARLGNNPLIIAIPHINGHVVLDMAISQYSYGKMQEYDLKNEPLPFAGGYDAEGKLTTNAKDIMKSKRSLPIGYWKGSGLSLVLDILVTSLSSGISTADITRSGKEIGVSQVFIAINPMQLNDSAINDILAYTKSSTPVKEGESIRYPGEGTLLTRKQNLEKGIPVIEEIWEKVKEM
ncbi:MAG TPA: 3-dehydro-L-gulonate 2-dehydrogenase [Flavisolibacter sp.]|nr:3-dehydro-L-gulonate 2-dehydrogenase [Flavisolibacter sp.]